MQLYQTCSYYIYCYKLMKTIISKYNEYYEYNDICP